MSSSEIKVLVFDVFGTVVDYRGSIIREGELLNKQKGLYIDWGKIADAWRGRYRPALDRVLQGEIPWAKLDEIHRQTLDETLAEAGITTFTEDEKVYLNRVWHRLMPWSDAIPGLTQLRRHFMLVTLSNGNMSLLARMAKYSGLPWDCILSTELVRSYKPDPRTYQMVINLLDLLPGEIMLVASHQYDLLAAHGQGLKTAFILRPLEHGPERIPDLTPDPRFDFVASDLLDLAQQLLGTQM
jgi:2-haloacid dehalogenase